jgi:predicted RNase H-like HicB family nuclease
VRFCEALDDIAQQAKRNPASTWTSDQAAVQARRASLSDGKNGPADDRMAESQGGMLMKNEFTAIIEKDGSWYVAYCPEIPGANGQGKTKDEARENLGEAIQLILEDRREDGLRGLPPDAIRETVTVQ